MSRGIDTGYVHTIDNLREKLDSLVFQANEKGDTITAFNIEIIGRVGVLLAERLEGIVNVLEDMEKTL